MKFWITLGVFIFAIGSAQSENCNGDKEAVVSVCFGVNEKNPNYFGEWKRGNATGIGIIIYDKKKVYIGGVHQGLPERRGVLLQDWQYSYGLWSNGSLARTEDIPPGFINDSLMKIGANLKEKKAPSELLETLSISKSLIPDDIEISSKNNILESIKKETHSEKLCSRHDLNEAKEKCKLLGFRELTESYGKCVLIISK